MSIVQRQHPADFLGAERFQSALSSLLEANVYAQLTDSDPWEFAVEAPYLLKRGLSRNDLRFLVGIRVLDYAHEIRIAGQASRQFRHTPGLSITKRTCFVLSSKGIRTARVCVDRSIDVRGAEEVLNGQSAVQLSLPAQPVPMWEADRRVLTYDGEVVKRFKWRALNQEAVLNAFQEENWPYRILDPIAPHPAQDIKRRLSETIKCLNRSHENNLIRFRGDGTGQGVVWESTL